MGQMTTHRSRMGLMAAGLAMTIANIAPTAAFADHRLTLPVGTVIPVKLEQSLSSKNNQPGDRVFATVKDGRDDAGLPIGTRVEGVVREALPSRDGKAGVLDVDFRRIIIPGDQSRTIDATLYTLNGKDIKRQDGRLVATGDKGKDRLKWIGIGAGAGFLLGTITKGNALFDALLGAGAGYLYSELQGKKAGDVNLKEGTEFGLRLDRPLDFNVDDRNYDRWQGRLENERYYDDRFDPADRNRDRYDDRYRNRNSDDRYYRRGNERSYERSNYNSRIHRDNGDIGMLIDQREIKFSAAKPFVRNEIVFVPLESISKSVDVGYRYDASDRVIRARDGKVRMNVGSRVVFVNGERRILPAAAEVKDGVIYVPMQFVGWMTNGSAAWDSVSRTVIVTTDRDRD